MADLSELRAIPAARARLDAAELELIDRARRGGATWADIAAALGLGSRQAAEQRRVRLAAAVRPRQQEIDDRFGAAVVALRAAAVELHRRIGSDGRWDGRFVRAGLVRETLAAAVEAPPGSLFALDADVVADLAAARPPVPQAMRAAIDGLRKALAAASPHS